MKQDTTFVAIDDSKRTLVLGILRPGADAPETRSIPNEPRHVQRLFARMKREGPVRVCYEAGPPATTFTASSRPSASRARSWRQP